MAKEIDNIPPNFNRYLDFLEKELSVREKEAETNKAIQLKTIESADKDSDRNFEVFKEQNKHEADRNKFIRHMGYISIGIFFIVLCFSGYLVVNGNPIGEKLLNTTISLVIGGFGGWGLRSLSNK